MNAGEIVAEVEARGVRLQPRDNAIAVMPGGVLEDAEREALRAHKAAVLAFLQERTEQQVQEVALKSLWSLDRTLEIAVPWWPETLFLVPGPGVARQLAAEGISPGRIWTTAEALDLLLTGVSPDDARCIAETKLTMAGTVVGAWRTRAEG